MEPELLKHEYTEIYARGTGARNHNTSVVMLKEKSYPLNRIENDVKSNCKNYTLVTRIKGTEGGAAEPNST